MTRAEQAAQGLATATNLLNSAIALAEESIQGLGLGVSAEIDLPRQHGDRDDWRRRLGFGKLNDKWRLFYGEGTDDDFVENPLLNASREARTMAVALIPVLVEELIAAAESSAKAIGEQAEVLEKFAGWIGRTR